MVARWSDQQAPMYQIRFEGIDITVRGLSQEACCLVQERFGIGSKPKTVLRGAGIRARKKDAVGYIHILRDCVVVPLRNGPPEIYELKCAWRIIDEFDVVPA